MATDKEARIRFRAETDEFQQALKASNQELSSLRSEMKLNEAQFQNSGDKTEYLKSKQEILGQQLQATRDKEDALNSELEIAREIYGENSTEAANLERQLNYVKAQEESLQAQMSSVNSEIDANDNAYRNLQTTITEQETALAALKEEYAAAVLQYGENSDEAGALAMRIEELSGDLNENKELYNEVRNAANDYDVSMGEVEEGSRSLSDTLMDLWAGSEIAGKIGDITSKAYELAEAFDEASAIIVEGTGASGDVLAELQTATVNAFGSMKDADADLSDVAGVVAELNTRLGVTGPVVESLAGDVLKFSQHTGTDAVKSVDSLVNVSKRWNLEASDMGSLMDDLTTANQACELSVDEMTGYLTTNSVQFQALGYSVEDALALMISFSDGGANTSSVMMGMKQAVANLSDATDDVPGAFQLAIDTIASCDDVSEALSATVGDTGKTVQDVFGKRAAQEIAACVQNGNFDIGRFSAALRDNQGVMGETAENATTMGDEMSRATNNVAVIFDRTMAPAITATVHGMADLVQGFSDLPPETQKVVVGIMAGVAAMKAWKVIADTKIGKTLALDVSGLRTEVLKNTVATTGLTGAELARAAATNAATVATNAANMALKALGKAAPIIAITALVAGVSIIADAFGKAAEEADKQREHEEKLAQASDGLRDASIGLGAEIKNVGDALEGEADAIELVDVDALADKHIELANSITEMKSAAMTSVAQLSDYASVIDELGGRSDLSAEEAARLELALAGVNESCGTNYELVRDSGGAYQIMADGAIVAKDAILQVVEAQKYQVQQEALLKEMSATYSQLREDNEKLAQAQRAVTDAQAAYDAKLAENGGQRYYYNQMTGEYVDLLASEAATLDAARGSYAEIEGQLGTTQSAYNKLTEETTLNQMAMAQGASAFLQAAASSDTFKQNVLACDVDLVNFTQSLESMGFTSEQVSSMSAEQVQTLALAWNSGSMSMVEACNQAGIAIPDAMAAADGGFSAHAQGIIDKATQTSGITAEQFSQLASQLGASGEGAMIALASGINANAAKGPDAARIVKQAIVLELCKGDVERAAQMLGGDIDAGLAAGISGTAEMPAEAAGIMSQATIDAAKDAFESHSPSEVMRRLGDDVDAGLANGINESEPQPTSAMSTTAEKIREAIASLPSDMTATGDGSGAGLASGISGRTGDVRNAGAGVKNAAQNGIASLPGDMTATGDSSGSGLASGINSRMNDVRGAGANVKNAANSGVSGTAALLGGEGSSASSSFASGVMSARGSAESNAFAMADAAANMKRDVGSSWQWGSDLGQGFANGISGMIDRVKSGAVSMANAIRSVLHFSVPDEGPLADADEYGPDFAELLASGIERGAPSAKRAAMGLARDIKSALDIGQNTLEPSAKAVVDLNYVNRGIEAALSASTLLGPQAQIDELEQLGAKLDGVRRSIERLDGGLGRKIAENAPDGYPGDRAFRREMRRAGWKP